MGDEQEAMLTRLANKAKRKLNKQSKEVGVENKPIVAKYEYLTGNVCTEARKKDCSINKEQSRLC